MANEVSSETQTLLREAIALHRQGELTLSERAYEKVLEIDPNQTDALQLLGVIAAQMGNTTLAIERVNRSIAINPRQPGALNNLGNMLVEEDRYEEAIDAYERAIHFDPKNAQAYLHLGHVFGYVDRHLDAVRAYQRCTELEPENAAAWNSLGSELDKVGRSDDAVQAYRRSIEIDPNYQSPKDGLGKVLRQLGRLDEALQVYQQWLAIAPDNPIAKHYVLVCGSGDSTPDRASAEYVKSTFDGFAESFDSQLSDLDYRVPDLIGDLVQELFAGEQAKSLRVVDLGCGTGLCATHLRGLSAHLVGVDLSPGMLEKASQRNLYDELIEAELTEYLGDCSENFDLMVSADTLIYIGDLRSTFAVAAGKLQPGRPLVFSIEKLETGSDEAGGVGDAGYRLGSSGRYQHTEACIRNWLDDNGFAVQSCVEAEVRKEGRDVVTGYLFTAIRNQDD